MIFIYVFEKLCHLRAILFYFPRPGVFTYSQILENNSIDFSQTSPQQPKNQIIFFRCLETHLFGTRTELTLRLHLS